MENHPIPQDVTGFQFRLIGSLTVKQFGYIGVSVVAVVILYYAPLSWFVKAPLMVLFGCIGPALAFLPIEGRPMDQMASHFVHALIRPNQYLFIKSGGKLPLSLLELHSVRQLNEKELAEKKAEEDKTSKREERLNMYLQQIHQSTAEVDKKEEAFTKSVVLGQPLQPQPTQSVTQTTPASTQAAPASTIQVAPPPAPTIQNNPMQQNSQVIQQESEILKELAEAKQEEATSNSPQQTQAAHEKVSELSQKLQEALAKQAALQKEIERLTKTSNNTQQTPAPSVAPAQTTPTAGAIKLTTDMAKREGIAVLPQDPNLVIGIVKDPRGNILPNILVEIKDTSGNPVRAFKTNLQGQFKSATPLPNGEYTIVFEDPKGEAQFDAVALSVTGAVIPPLEILSHDAREALRQQLFG